MDDHEKYCGRSLILDNRRSGKTTAHALYFIAIALKYPGAEVNLYDHIPSNSGLKALYDIIERSIEKLEFKGFELNKTKGTLKFRLFKGIG